jgi:hypothetical protein
MSGVKCGNSSAWIRAAANESALSVYACDSHVVVRVKRLGNLHGARCRAVYL